jgi:hypothetical protein
MAVKALGRYVEPRVFQNAAVETLVTRCIKRCESWKLLDLRIARVNREASCGKAIALLLGDRAEVGGTEKNSELDRSCRGILTRRG